MQYRIPVSSWSKAPWGLSVLAQVTSIFTGISISPDALSRQRPNHYAFRAGRNLPDKEFRYLRTVIVTAAVYWGLTVAWTNSLRPLAWHSLSRSYGVILPSSLTILLPSALGFSPHPPVSVSLTILLPSALGFSPHPPVSVYGTGTIQTIAAFLDSWLTHFATLISLRITT